MTDTFDAVLADVREEAERRDYQDGVLTTDEVRYHLDRLAAAHAAEVAKRDARIAELETNAADRESEIEAIKAERGRAEDQAEAASGQGVECEHKRTEPRRTHVRCLDCESVKTDSDPSWGAARDRWFPSLPAARAAAAPTQEKGNG